MVACSDLDNDYQRIKVKMLEQLQSLDCQIVFSCHMKTKETFCQNTKESVYISLLTSVVKNVGEELEIIFDSFGKADFEAAIIEKVGSLDNVVSIVPGDSEKEHGLQFVDNICSVIRLHKSNDVKDFYYNYVKKDLREV